MLCAGAAKYAFGVIEPAFNSSAFMLYLTLAINTRALLFTLLIHMYMYVYLFVIALVAVCFYCKYEY